MANFIPSKHEASEYNNGVQYVDGNGVQPTTINKLIESALYSQGVSENAQTISNNALDKVEEVINQQIVSPSGNYQNMSVGKATNDENGNNIANQFSEIWKKIYPVGAYYISNENTSPASIFGGSWSPITGRFLYANAGNGTGGTNALIARMTLDGEGRTRAQFATTTSWDSSYYAEPSSGKGGDSKYIGITSGVVITGQNTDEVLPPYKTVYAWRRTA